MSDDDEPLDTGEARALRSQDGRVFSEDFCDSEHFLIREAPRKPEDEGKPMKPVYETAERPQPIVSLQLSPPVNACSCAAIGDYARLHRRKGSAVECDGPALPRSLPSQPVSAAAVWCDASTRRPAGSLCRTQDTLKFLHVKAHCTCMCFGQVA